MKNNKFLLPVILVVVLFAALLTGMLMQIFIPAVILPPLNIPNMVLLSVVALVVDHFFTKGSQRCYVCVALFSLAAFAVLPLMAGFACVHDFWKIGLVGGITFTITTFLFSSAIQRLRTGPKTPAAVILTALGIYLAAQCFAGIIL